MFKEKTIEDKIEERRTGEAECPAPLSRVEFR